MHTLLRRLPRLPLLVVLAFCLVTTSLVNPGFAWCFDGNGQAEFTPVNAGDCCIETASPPVVVQPAQACCGDTSCLDVSAHPHWRSQRNRVLTAMLVLPPLAADQIAVPLALVASRVPSGQFPSPSPPRIPETILLHRTVVLLI